MHSHSAFDSNFVLLQCFCFEEQRLNPHEQVRGILEYLVSMKKMLIGVTTVEEECCVLLLHLSNKTKMRLKLLTDCVDSLVFSKTNKALILMSDSLRFMFASDKLKMSFIFSG